MDGQQFQFAQNVTAQTEEKACEMALTVMGLSFYGKKRMKKGEKAKDILYDNGCHLRKKK